jgi:hypothetical protein
MSQEVIEGELVRPLAVRETYAPAEWTPRFASSVDDQLEMLRERDRFYRERLKEGVHYGVIPGTQKPTLYKPGAEALLSGMGLRSETGNESPPVVDFTGKDHNGEPFIMYDRYCRIYRQTGPTVNDRIEVANLGGGGWVCFKKKDGCGAKFRDGDSEIESQSAGKVANEDVAELQNTIKKMADKRALIAATLVATGCSDIFTQDIEDMPASFTSQPSQGITIKDAEKRGDERNAQIQADHAEVVAKKADTDEAKRARVRDAIMISCREHGISDERRHAVSKALFGWESTSRLTLPKLRELRSELKELAAAKIEPENEDSFRLWLTWRTDIRNEVAL